MCKNICKILLPLSFIVTLVSTGLLLVLFPTDHDTQDIVYILITSFVLCIMSCCYAQFKADEEDKKTYIKV